MAEKNGTAETARLRQDFGKTNPVTPDEMSGKALAYLGDAVLELLVRRQLVLTGLSHAGELNSRARSYVTAARQSAGVEALLPLLSEKEEAVYRRGRNAAGAHPKSATVSEDRRATGLEARFGWLSLCGEEERLAYLYSVYAKAMEEVPSAEAVPSAEEVPSAERALSAGYSQENGGTAE